MQFRNSRHGTSNGTTGVTTRAAHSILIPELDLPHDFPVGEFEAAELGFRARTGTSPIALPPTWQEFATAWITVAYRYLDVAHFDESLRRSLRHAGAAPPPDERYLQERYLFAFFVGGLSAIESACYGICAIAWEAAGPGQAFDLATQAQQRAVTPRSVRNRLQEAFSGDAVTSTLDRILRSSEYKEWAEIRNALAHRTSPPRKHYTHIGASSPPEPPPEWGTLVFDEKMTATRRDWLRSNLGELLADAGRFTAKNF
jgi:hypothetical protein